MKLALLGCIVGIWDYVAVLATLENRHLLTETWTSGCGCGAKII